MHAVCMHVHWNLTTCSHQNEKEKLNLNFIFVHSTLYFHFYSVCKIQNSDLADL